jgi:hypothetical protein
VSALDDARKTADAARAARRAAVRDLTVVDRASASAVRRGDRDEAERLLRARREAAARLEAAQAAEARAQAVLDRAVLGVLEPDVERDLARLDARIPVVLLPVRVESRFFVDAEGYELRVRIYPDSIAADTHEAALTDTERAAGEAFWRAAWTSDELAAWQTLVDGRSAARAAWIAEALTPTNIADRPDSMPTFPDAPSRTHTWTRPAEARLLPERWLVVAYRGSNEVARAETRQPVTEPLVLTMAPDTDADDALEWAYDFTRAEQAGMGVRLRIPREDAAAGIDVFCLGVKVSLPPEQVATSLASLLSAHRASRGLALVPQGSPTNNTSATRAIAVDVDAEASFAIARGAPMAVEDTDGAHLADALGIPRQVFDHVAAADGTEQRRARAMNNALWPATLGYFLDQMMAPVFNPSDIQRARQWFVNQVRGRGPVPAFRVGSVPYGVLPVTALARWPAEQTLARELQRLRPLWAAAIRTVPAVRPGAAPSEDLETDLVAVLAMDASARELWIRHVVGQDTMWSLGEWFGLPSGWLDPRRAMAREILESIGHPDWDPRILSMIFDGEAKRFVAPLVAARVDDRPLDPDYIAWLRRGGWIDVLLRRAGETEEPTALLYRMLSYAVHREVDRHAFAVLLERQRVTAGDRREPELVGIVPGTEGRLTVAQRLTSKVTEVSGDRTLAEHLWDPGVLSGLTGAPTVRESLADLVGVATAELQRLFTETLDTCSHRLDAWITSLATARLAELRAARPAVSFVGAFGWVEGLRPRALSPNLPPNLGFVHAPSMDHATAAAILRNAWGSTTGDARQRYAVNLSSARIRKALDLLAAVREGQPLGAVLGYRFERALHDAELDLYKEPFRLIYPLRVDRRDDSTGPIDPVASRDVVDGLALRLAYRDGTIPWDRVAVEGAPVPQAEIIVVLAELDDLIDAVADVLLSEAVYQLVRGNVAGAHATFEAIAGGSPPPEPEIVRQPRGGTAIVHRCGVLVGARVADDGWPASGAARSAAEPDVDGWLASRLGRADTAVLDLSWLDQRRRLTVAELGLRPLDLLALLRGEQTLGQDSELDRRALRAIHTTGSPRPPDDADVTITYSPGLTLAERATIRTAATLFDQARTWSDVLSHARPLVAADLALPEEASDAASAAEVLTSEAHDRADDAIARIEDLRVLLPPAIAAGEAGGGDLSPAVAALRTHLRECADVGVAGAHPRPTAGLDELLVQVRAALLELDRRSTAIAALPASASPAERASAALGAGTLLVVRFVPHRPELDQAFAAGPAKGATWIAVQRWQQQASRVHAGLGRWRRAELVSEVQGALAARFDIAQLPHLPDEPWVALRFGDEAQRPASGRLSIAMHRFAAPTAEDPWCGLWFDEWNEIVPNRRETTGVAFHFDAPNAEAPQAILVAVAPPSVKYWSAPLLLETLRDTLELAKIRGVDAERLGVLGHLLPTTFFPTNHDDEALRFDLIPHLVRPVNLGGG